MNPGHHPKPNWYSVLELLFPSRCREIPEAQNPDRIVLRQFAIVKRYVYLQQFASSEDERFMHSHQWRRTFAVGLRGSYTECRIAGEPRQRHAPYFYTMDDSVVHHVQNPSPDHLSLFIGIGRDDDLKHYYGSPETKSKVPSDVAAGGFAYLRPVTRRSRWEDHVSKMVARI